MKRIALLVCCAAVAWGQAPVPAQVRAREFTVDDEIKRGAIYDKIGKPRDWTVQGHTPPPPPSKDPIKR